MKIKKVESIPYGIPVKNFADAYTSFTQSNAVLIKLFTDEDIIEYLLEENIDLATIMDVLN